jgi:recombinational DNA repair protein RecT
MAKKAESPWVRFPEEMAKKACLKRAVKKISFDNPDFYKVLDIDNKEEFDFKKARIEVNNGIASPNAIDSLFEADSVKHEE